MSSRNTVRTGGTNLRRPRARVYPIVYDAIRGTNLRGRRIARNVRVISIGRGTNQRGGRQRGRGQGTMLPRRGVNTRLGRGGRVGQASTTVVPIRGRGAHQRRGGNVQRNLLLRRGRRGANQG